MPLYKLGDDEFIAVDGARLYEFNFDLDTLWVRTYDYWFVAVRDVFQLRNGNLLLCGTCPVMLEVSPDDGSVVRTGVVSVDTLYIRWVRPLYEKPNGDLILAAILGIPGDFVRDSTTCIVCVDSTWEPKWVEDIYDPRIEHLFFITPPLIEVNESTYIGVGPAKVLFDSTRICFIKLVHSDTTSGVVETTPTSITFSAYPNPFNSSVVISAPVGSKISIYDINGQMVLPPRLMKGSHLEWQPSKTLPSGIYIVKVHLRQGATITGRIIYLK
ncbi:T9SS type A sorting domain-containing protein [bacterium]|nr:T9SS type A sorting domain-containing protein [bacterium]